MAGTIVAGTLSDGTYSGSVTDTVRGACKAWVNFNGQGTVAIRAAYNVSSITDNGTGDYTVNFTTAMTDANYALNGTAQFGNDNAGSLICNITIARLTTPLTTSSARIQTYYFASTGAYGLADPIVAAVSIFR